MAGMIPTYSLVESAGKSDRFRLYLFLEQIQPIPEINPVPSWCGILYEYSVCSPLISFAAFCFCRPIDTNQCITIGLLTEF